MAEKKSGGTTFETIMHDLKAGQYAPVYVLMGEESYYIDRITDYIAEHVLREEERDFNLTVVFGADVSAGQVADLARRFPMMAERQVVIVKEAQNIKNWDRLEAYFEKPQPTTVLVLAYNFIEGYLKTKQCTIDNKATLMIADHIGADLSRLTSELDKVVMAMPENDRRITPEVVEQQIGVSKDFNGFELRSAIANRDIVKANRIVKYFDSNPKTGSAFMLIPLLFSYFQNLMIAYYSPGGRGENEVARWLDLRNGWAAKEYVLGMRNYSAMKVMQIIYKIREIDAKSKGLDNPNTGVGELLKELVAFIFY